MLASRRHNWIRAGLILVVVILIGMFWYRSPRTIIENEPATIAEIQIKNGNTGEIVSITDPTQIDYLIKNINKLELKRDGISLGQMGYQYHLIVYAKDQHDIIGWNDFIINSSDIIRKDPFFYQVQNYLIDIKYLENLFTN